MATLSIEDEVLGNVRQMPLGPADAPVGTVADLNLPLEYLRRVGDRVIQASFRERWRVVVGGGIEHSPPSIPEGTGVPGWVRVLDRRPMPGGTWIECRPGVRGFRAPVLGGAPWPMEAPTGAAASAAKAVGSRLAVDGLAKTLKRLGPMTQSALREAGIPTDLVAEGRAQFRKAVTGFRAAAENGEKGRECYRLQLTSPNYYAGVGDGGSLDVLRQLVEARSGTTFIVSLDEKHLAGVLAHVSGWNRAEGVSLTLVPEAMAVSQWARDNGVAGLTERDGEVVLVPRWAGRGEEGGIFIPGESFVCEGWVAAGVKVSQSSLVFEGGNVMMVDDGRRVLLVGEAEVWRNTALGLTREEVLAALREEFGAEACVVLPAASFHIDLEVTVGGGRGAQPVAFVLDTLAAVRVVCGLAARRLAEAALMSAEEARACANPGATLGELAGTMHRVLDRAETGPGQYRLEFATLFRVGDVDSGVGNIKRVLTAMDWLTAELGAGQAGENHYAGYLRSLRRQERDRAAIARQLRQLGWKVVRVPGMSGESVSLNPVNGVWVGREFLMPAYGGFFAELDLAAAKVIGAEGFTVTPVLTGETQRRGGGLHCAVGLA